MNKLPEQIQCPHCQINLNLEESERIGKRFICPSCEKQVDLNEDNIQSKNAEVMQPAFVYHDNKILGPYAIEVLKKMILDGLVFPTDQVWNSAMQTRISAQEYLSNLNDHEANNIQIPASPNDGPSIPNNVRTPNQLPEEITKDLKKYPNHVESRCYECGYQGPLSILSVTTNKFVSVFWKTQGIYWLGFILTFVLCAITQFEVNFFLGILFVLKILLTPAIFLAIAMACFWSFFKKTYKLRCPNCKLEGYVKST